MSILVERESADRDMTVFSPTLDARAKGNMSSLASEHLLRRSLRRQLHKLTRRGRAGKSGEVLREEHFCPQSKVSTVLQSSAHAPACSDMLLSAAPCRILANRHQACGACVFAELKDFAKREGVQRRGAVSYKQQ